MTRSGTYGGSPISQVRRYVYDPNQMLCKTIEAESGATLLSYNASNLVEWKASGQALTDPANCQTVSVGANQKVSYDYDQRDRLWRTRYGDGSPSVVIDFTPDGLPESVQSDNSTWTTLYNKRRMVTSETLNLSGTNYPLSYTHDPNGHIASLTYPDGGIVAYASNALGEATQVGNYASGITRYPNGALKDLIYGNGIAHLTQQNVRGLPSRSTDAGILDDGYSYDENGNVNAITDHLAGAFTRTMTYDDRDRLETATNTPIWGGTHTFVYDPLDHLREMATPKNGAWVYRYSALTQRLDQIDRPSDGLVILSYGYDARGRATSRGSTGAAQTFAVDLADRVTGIGPSVAAYRYDGHGRRTSVTKAGARTVEIYSQAGQLMYQSSDGIFRSGFQSGDIAHAPSAAGRRYVYLGRHLIAEDGTTGRQYIHTDGLGSPGRKTSVTGTPSGREDYKPYGYVFSPAQSTPGFTGHVTDGETGLSYMQARYYDPYAGRFLAVDPVSATTASFNRYWYANNSPYKFIDPDGRQACDGISTCRVASDERAVARGDMTQQQKQANDTARGIGALIAIPVAAAILIAPEVLASGGAAAAAKGAVGAGTKEVAKEGVEAVPQLIRTNPKNLIPTQAKSEMSGSQVNRLAKDMKKNGYDGSKPVDAVRNERGRLEIVDGHHRTEAAKKVGIKEIPVNVWGKKP